MMSRIAGSRSFEHLPHQDRSEEGLAVTWLSDILMLILALRKLQDRIRFSLALVSVHLNVLR
jgi:hypothetical protein